MFAQRPGLGSKPSLARDIAVKMSTAVVLPVVGMSNTELESQNEGCCRLTVVLPEDVKLFRIIYWSLRSRRGAQCHSGDLEL